MTSDSAPVDNRAIKVISWPPIWMYWPAYLAMADTEEELGGQIVFELVCPKNPTDESLRKKFRELAAMPHERVAALCEPREMSVLVEGERHERIVRRLPIIWRQPHWVLSTKSGEKHPTGEGKIWAYPRDTTSGDFVADVANRLKLFAGKKLEPIETEFSDERARVASGLGPNDFAVTFTPWHEILTATAEQSPLSSVPLPGPARNVTAIQFLDDGRYNLGDQSLGDLLAKHLKNILDCLYETQGDRELVEELIGRNSEKVRRLLARTADIDEPAWLDNNVLSRALAEYVRLGCYFPYKVVDSAISAEIQKRMGDVLDELKPVALQQLQSLMTSFLGGSERWQELSFDQRASVLLTTCNDETLWSFLTHNKSRSSEDLASALAQIRTKTSPFSQSVRPRQYLEDLTPECADQTGDTFFARRDHCIKSEAKNGTVKAADWAQAGRNCVSCVLGGSAASFLRPAAAYLANQLGAEVAYYQARADNDLTYDFPCPLSYGDVRPLLEHFAGEADSSPERSHEGITCPATVVAYNGVGAAPEGASLAGEILFGIWWRGLAERKLGSGRTPMRFRKIRDAHTAAGRPVAWIGSWMRTGNENGSDSLRVHQVSADKWDAREFLSNSHAPLTTPMGLRAAKDFLNDKYTFGYVAAFKIPARPDRGQQ